MKERAGQRGWEELGEGRKEGREGVRRAHNHLLMLSLDRVRFRNGFGGLETSKQKIDQYSFVQATKRRSRTDHGGWIVGVWGRRERASSRKPSRRERITPPFLSASQPPQELLQIAQVS